MLLRVCLAASLLTGVFSTPLLAQAKTGEYLLLLTVVTALSFALCIGFFTPLCCSLAIVLQIVVAQRSGCNAPVAIVLDVLQTAALALLGAGAYSLDARLYGRRIVIVPKRRPW